MWAVAKAEAWEGGSEELVEVEDDIFRGIGNYLGWCGEGISISVGRR